MSTISNSSPQDWVQTTVQNGVLTITLNRPKANAINVATSRALYAAFERLHTEPDLRVAIITGTGRFFSAGWDLNSANEGEAIDAYHGPGGFAGLTEFFSLGKPVIAAVNGLAMGGGFELALAADLVVCSQEAQFALPEATLGMMADSGGVLRLPKRLPDAIVRELLMTGRRMGADEAQRWGLVNRVVASDQLLATAQALAEQISASAPLALAAIKEVLAATWHQSVPDGYQTLRSGTLAAYQAMLTSGDAKEGPTAFAEKRPAKWQGR